ncbi:MAG: chemotaxis-specific protein-glutamate methyltransferase CheB [Thermoanaerobaculia bacterium]
MKRRLRLAVVDDSLFVRKALCRVLENEPRIIVVGTAGSGEELLANLDKWQPDAVTLDLSMPGLGGLATLDRIMEWRRIPVIILSTLSTKDAPLTLETLHHGAVDFIDKGQISLVDFQELHGRLLAKLFACSTPHPEIVAAPVTVRRKPPRETADTLSSAVPPLSILLIGASTGGPPAIQRVLEDFGGPLPIPTCIVQHMPVVFTRAFADRLNAHLPMAVSEAGNITRLLPGGVYVAPSGNHLRVRQEGASLIAVLSRSPEHSAHCPSVDVMFESAVPIASKTLAVLLTGMGEDGAVGMSFLKRAGAITIAQNESSSVVYGMPRAAQELGAVDEQLHIDRIGDRIRQIVRSSRPQN